MPRVLEARAWYEVSATVNRHEPLFMERNAVDLFNRTRREAGGQTAKTRPEKGQSGRDSHHEGETMENTRFPPRFPFMPRSRKAS
ncbi:MAG: hypothetical protein LBL31_08460 [Spirochaetaceae bacterium]|jgi:hypothetical protein|nr:hypothetical protein [Spirochaetaceae bacterium]